MPRVCLFAILLALSIAPASSAADKPAPKAYRIPDADLKQRVIWGSTCEAPDGSALSFGGQDQESDDGIGHTRFRPAGGEWEDLYETLNKRMPYSKQHQELIGLHKESQRLAAAARQVFFDGKTIKLASLKKLQQDCEQLSKKLETLSNTSSENRIAQARALRGQTLLASAIEINQGLTNENDTKNKGILQKLTEVAGLLERAAECLFDEPNARALSPLVYVPEQKVFVLFGGDHGDFLTNDLWFFDPDSRHWEQPRQQSEIVPRPRAGHTLKVNDDGNLVMQGGYTYTSSTDYCGSQYARLEDGEWTYDISNLRWSGPKEAAVARGDLRTYRTGPFDPAFYWQDPQPSAEEFGSVLKSLPANTWVATKPPHLPQLNRDWGTAVYDADHDLILRFSGGHSAHGGTDVLQYHCQTNRWELCFPVEFPLGQLYSNTSYPEGFNLNRRPWVTGHTYQSYGYDGIAKRMIFSGQRKHSYLYDPAIGDWEDRIVKPESMNYDSCFYTLTTCATPAGLVCWTNHGKLLRYDAKAKSWQPLELHGAKLPESSVDNSTLVYDSQRDRLLFARKPYGDPPYDGILHSVDLKTLLVERLEPEGSGAASQISYLCQLRYDAEHDLVLCGCTLPAGEGGLRRTPAYDCQSNRWVSLAIGGDDPSGPKGRNVSLGMMYDAGRKLFWAVDTHSHVYCLRLDPKSADLRPLQ